jgi:F420-0:gamma-glutamyl ligase-like protein
VLEDQEPRKIVKVIISSNLFRGVNLKEKPVVDKDNVIHFPPGEFEPLLVDTWSKYIFGYVEAWFWGRLEQKAEDSTRAPK